MEIKIDEYVRTDKGYIFIEHNKMVQGLKLLNIQYGNIVKHSKDIKKLLQEGDLIKYKLKGINSIQKDFVKKYKDARSGKEELGIAYHKFEDIEILEILTHEQYTKNVYRVKEDK